nr:MAG TPA: hypothetical protein [Caudoviricetes sp.]
MSVPIRTMFPLRLLHIMRKHKFRPEIDSYHPQRVFRSLAVFS